MDTALLIEDDKDVATLLKEEIQDLGYLLEVATDGEFGLELALSKSFGFILLDLRLPKLGGLEVCKRIREQDSETPIIIISSQSDEINTVLLLEIGADDFVTKPFRIAELKARIKAALRRTQSPRTSTKELEQAEFRYRHLVIQYEKRKVLVNNTPVETTNTEFQILAKLVSYPGRPFTKEELVEAVHGGWGAGYEKSIANHINRLRNKIELKPEEPELILTLRGVGYCFTDQPES